MLDRLPPGYVAAPPTVDPAETVADLVARAQVVDCGGADAAADAVRDDWTGIDLAEEAILVRDADGAPAAYADLVNRANEAVSVYGIVDPDHRGRGLGPWLTASGERWGP